jgi:hypothetical protein
MVMLSDKELKNMGINLFGKEVKYYVNQTVEVVDRATVITQELYILTQVILNTLNTEPARFHNMSELPGLESRNWHQLNQVARYLLKQGWIESKTIECGLLIKLTLKGKILMTNDDG